MTGKVYVPLIGGLGATGIGAALVSSGVDLGGALILGGGVAAVALALYYWRGSRAHRS